MKFLRSLSLVVLVLSLIAFAGSFVYKAQMQGSAETYQLVTKNPDGDLFGDPYNTIGSPQTFIVSDKEAILPLKDDAGHPYLSQDVLQAKHEYPLQLQTVEFIASNTRLGSEVAFVLGILGFLLANRLLKRKSTSEPTEAPLTDH